MDIQNENYQNFNFYNSMWCVVISMTTVGFGDFYPVTIYGRLIIMIAVFFGVLVLALLLEVNCKLEY